MRAFTSGQERLLLALAVFGLLVPNGVFLWFAFADTAPLLAALRNPVALVFIAEAFLLTGLFAWVVHRAGLRSPGWAAFVLMSLAGSLAFSVPAFLFLASRRARRVTSAP